MLGLEALLPRLEERLITTLELAEGGAAPGTSPRLREALALPTAGQLQRVRVDRLVDPAPPFQYSPSRSRW